MSELELRTMSFEVAEAVAPTWERRRDFIEAASTPVREWMVAELGARPGQTVLELAAGVGDTGFEIAETIGDSGRLISSDFSPAMLEAARRRGAELGIENVEYRVIDAERIDLAPQSVDGVLCRFGYMLMTDAGAALAETRRVLRPGGRLTLAVWAGPEQNPFFSTIATALVEGGHMPPPEPEGPGIFSLASPECLRERLTEAGFGEVRIEEVPVRFPVTDAGHYLAVARDTAGPIAMALRNLDGADLAAIEADLAEALSRLRLDEGHGIPGVALVAAAS